MVVLRDGERVRKEVQLTERPGADADPEVDDSAEDTGIEWLGIRYQDLSPGLRQLHGVPEDVEGVFITEISPRSRLYADGVRVERIVNVITEVNGRPVRNVDEFEEIVEAAPSGSRLRIFVRRFAGGNEGSSLFSVPEKP